jgi:hypothetical protein
MMKVTGHCHCGAIAFEAEIDPASTLICHCTDCQALTGTAFRVTARGPETAFHLLRGQPKIYIKTGDSGRKRQLGFCGDCGSPLYSTSDEPPGNRTMGLRVGVLDQRKELVPRHQIFFRSVLPWLPKMPGPAAHADT